MAASQNEQRELEKIIARNRAEGLTPRLFLHSCCAPCSSYVLEYLSEFFEITDFYYNPNITERDEFDKRSAELQRLIRSMPLKNPVTFVEGRYDPALYFETVKGLEAEPEGGARCLKCFRLRLEETARMASEGDERGPFDCFTTTLTISPLKNAASLNAIGREMSERYGVAWLPSDFKKKNGYLRSIELSREYELYRQNYCGCVFSKRESCDRINANSSRLGGDSQ